LLEVTDAVIKVWGAGRVGVRLSPNNPFNGMSDYDPSGTYSYVVRQLNERPLAYLHILESFAGSRNPPNPAPRLTPFLKTFYKGVLMVNGGYTKELAEDAIWSGEADLVSFGVPFIANPDLVERFVKNAPLNKADPSTFYSGEEKGYIDYPLLTELERVEVAV
jgi:N-ethylmaleimide reductase